jgi:hypothetical protein
MTTRDELTMQVLGWRQLVRDMPEEELPAAKRLFKHFEQELAHMSKKKARQ